MPRIGVVAAGPGQELLQGVREAGGEPVHIPLPGTHFPGVALTREWVADTAQAFTGAIAPDSLLMTASDPEVLAGLTLAALRMDLPTVLVPSQPGVMASVLQTLGLAPLAEESAEAAMELARSGAPRPRDLVESFALANALRVSCALNGGPEPLVHIAAIAREAGAIGFGQMLRVLIPEATAVAEPGSQWFTEHGVPGLLSYIGEIIHDTPTVTGRLKDELTAQVPPDPEPLQARFSVMQGMQIELEALGWASGTDAVYASGPARVFISEDEAVKAVEREDVEPHSVLVLPGCGPAGGPGLFRTSRLAQALNNSGLANVVAVLTDGVAPASSRGVWVSLAQPEAASGGVLGRIRDGDTLYIGLDEGVIHVGVPARELKQREAYPAAESGPRFGYGARYRLTALPALEGAGFAG